MNTEQIKQLTEILGVNKKEEEVTTDAVGSWLSQVSIALLIVFIIAYVLFAGGAQLAIEKAVKNANEAKIQAGFWSKRAKDLETTPVGKAREDQANALIDLQKARLRVILERVEFQVKCDFGIVTFAPRDNDGKINYRLSEILSGSKVVSELFKGSCVRAKEALSDQQLMEQEWFSRILLTAGVQDSKSLLEEEEESIVEHPERLTRENDEWLTGEISTRIEAIYFECRDMQYMALSYLYRYYNEHPEDLKNEELNDQLEKALNAPDKERPELISVFSGELRRQIKTFFETEGVSLLGGVQE